MTTDPKDPALLRPDKRALGSKPPACRFCAVFDRQLGIDEGHPCWYHRRYRGPAAQGGR
jgi:hypothetical protein